MILIKDFKSTTTPYTQYIYQTTNKDIYKKGFRSSLVLGKKFDWKPVPMKLHIKKENAIGQYQELKWKQY
jgi:hypothetical protein